MKKKIILFSSIGGAVLIAAIVLIICLCIPKSKSYRKINLYKVTNNVNVIRKDENKEVVEGMSLKNGDKVEVNASSSAILKLDNDKFIMAKENTTLTLVATGKSNNTKTKILVDKGGVVVEVKEKLKDSETFEIASSNSVMAIRGTKIGFDVEIDEAQNTIKSTLSLLDGKTMVYFLKDNELNQATFNDTLNKLTYTTNNNTSIDKVSELIDKKDTIKTVTDEDLETKFNVVKQELTSEEIDSMVDAVNNFERDNNKLNGVIKFTNKPENVEYGIDPANLIVTDKEYEGIKFYYSLTLDGEYNLEFDETTPFDLGDIYVKALAGDAYRSDPFKLTISTKKLNMEILGTQKSNYGSATMHFSADKYDEIFSKDFAQELGELGGVSKYKYYIALRATDGENDDKTLVIDYANKDVVFPYIYTSGATFNVTVTYNLPEFYDVTFDDSYEFSFKNELDFDNIIVLANYVDGTAIVNLFCEQYFATTINDEIKVQKIERDDYDQISEYIDVEIYNDYGELYFDFNSVDFVEIAIEAPEYDGTDKTKGYREVEIDFNRTDVDSGTTITDYGNSIFTFNEDGTMNAYFDSSFTTISDGVQYFSYIYCSGSGFVNMDAEENGYYSKLAIGSNSRVIPFEDLYQGTYYLSEVVAVTKYNQVYYTVRRSSASSISINPNTANNQFAILTNDSDDTTTIHSMSDCFDTNEDIILSYGEDYYKVSKSLMDGMTFNNYTINKYYDYMLLEATIYASFSKYSMDGSVTLYDVDGDPEYLTDDIFDKVKSDAKSKYDITIKGSNKTVIKDRDVRPV
ncbi:MAG: FecR domain-containing protein [Acholeplasmatales bacterium]|nr:FecR domain-containing protein [Acholeplasmatales bacterium]